MLVLMKVKDGSQVLATGVLLVLERPGSKRRPFLDRGQTNALPPDRG
jgi:hypothetical protein